MGKKFLITSILSVFTLLMLIFFMLTFQSLWMIDLLTTSPKTTANTSSLTNNKDFNHQKDPIADQKLHTNLIVDQKDQSETRESLSKINEKQIDGRIIKDRAELLQDEDELSSENVLIDPYEDDIFVTNQTMLTQQLIELLANRSDSVQLTNVLNQLSWKGDSDALSALMDAYQTTKYDGYHNAEILNAISKVTNAQSVPDLGNYLDNAVYDGDGSLLTAVSTAMANIGNEEATDMLIQSLSITAPETDASMIISGAVANIRNTNVAPILVSMIEQKKNGYEGAIEALLNLGDFGTEKISNLLTQDENVEYREKLLSVTETMQFDEETYYALNKLAELNEEYEDFFRSAGDNLAQNNPAGGFSSVE